MAKRISSRILLTTQIHSWGEAYLRVARFTATPDGRQRSTMEHLIVLYQNELLWHPVMTQVLTVATLLVAGDVISQTFLQQKPFFDVRQAANFFVVGLFYTGPCAAVWYSLVERMVVMNGSAAAIIKVLAGQVLFTPVFTLGLLVVYGLLKRDTWPGIVDNIKAKYFALLRSRFLLYPPAQFINFKFVPVVYRPIYASVVTLFWNMYLSWKANKAEEKTPTDPIEKDSREDV